MGSLPECAKCKSVQAAVVANQTEHLCAGCLHAALLGKFKSAINQHKLVQRGDRVLLAFSGGHSSRVALDFLQTIHAPSTSFSAQGSYARGRIPFDLGVVFLDERTATGVPDSEADRLVAQLEALVSSCGLTLQVERLESIYKEEVAAALEGLRVNGVNPDSRAPVLGAEPESTSDEVLESDSAGKAAVEDAARAKGSSGGVHKEQMLRLLDVVDDATAKQDLVVMLRMELLQKHALTRGYTRLVLGTNTSRIASHVLASISKGRGFSLPVDIQYFDSRRPVPVIRPLRDCAAEELAAHCHLAKLHTVFVPNMATTSGLPGGSRPVKKGLQSRSIDVLTMEFVASLQRENQSRQNTITRTALKLQPFPSNEPPSSESTLHQQATCVTQTSTAVTASVVSEAPASLSAAAIIQPGYMAAMELQVRQSEMDEETLQRRKRCMVQSFVETRGLEGNQQESVKEGGWSVKSGADGQHVFACDNKDEVLDETCSKDVMSLGVQTPEDPVQRLETSRFCALCLEPLRLPQHHLGHQADFKCPPIEIVVCRGCHNSYIVCSKQGFLAGLPPSIRWRVHSYSFE